MGVEQRQLLVTVNDIEGVVEIERHRRGWGLIAGAIEIEHDPRHANEVAQRERVLPAREAKPVANVKDG
jgi:hypothetical protein